MESLNAHFVKSSPDVKDCPPATLPEFAFIGRSNVGKSSLINMITDRRKLAHTSSKPGKTQLINHFLINEQWYLVDLPGYGFAKRSKKERESWERMIRGYLEFRENLALTFILIDARHEPLQGDKEFITWVGSHDLPFCLVFTKVDKAGPNLLQRNLAAYKNFLKAEFDELPFSVLSSAVNGQGKDQVLAVIEEVRAEYPATQRPGL